MRSFCDFKINGQPLLAPDEVPFGAEDIDAADAGRDESAVMHRKIVRANVMNWEISYSSLTEEEMAYTLNLLSAKPSFQFSFPAPGAVTQLMTVDAYISKVSLSYKNVRTGLYKNVKFKIIQL